MDESNEIKVNAETKSKDVTENESAEVESTKDCKNTDNVYAYLDRSDFTSEKFKIEIRGLPKYYGISELKKLLKDKLKLDSNKIKVPKVGSPWAYVCFRNDNDRDTALRTLNGYSWKGKILSASIADAVPDPLVKKRKELNESKNHANKKSKLEGTQEERLKMSTIPYCNYSYEKQLELKQNDIHQVLLELGNNLWKNNPILRPWIERQRDTNNGLPCELWNIRAAKNYNGYRTKCEFTVGMDYETKLPTVGFRLGSYVDGFTGVAPIDGLVHIPDRVKCAVKMFEKFVRNSELQIFNPEFQKGEFRLLTTRRSTTTDELMLIVGVQTKDMTDESLNKLKQDLINYFSEGDGTVVKVTSLFIKKVQKRGPDEPVPQPEHLFGTKYIQEKLLGLTFRISPEAFFQINTDAAEILYSSAIELVKPTSETCVIDICCGTGTIGLCFARHCGQVLGIELIGDAVIDAKANAQINNIDNAEFFEGKAEDILSSVTRKSKFNDIVAIVDPPRAGLHQKAVVQLRQARNLKKLLYVSCDPKAAMKNFVDLGRPPSKTLHNEPLIPIKAVAIDMFPHTKHCELLIYFERLKLSDLEDPKSGNVESKSVTTVESESATMEESTVEITQIKEKEETSESVTEKIVVETTNNIRDGIGDSDAKNQ